MPHTTNMRNPSIRSVTFSGALTASGARSTLLDNTAMEQYLARDTNPYVGEAPQELLNKTGLGPTMLRQQLDCLATQLSQDPKMETALIGNQRVKIRKLGKGAAGRVYKIEVGGRAYALKVFKRHSLQRNRARNISEIAVGAYFTAQPTKDMAAMYMANAEQGWMLTEFIDESVDVASRPGRTLYEQGWHCSDDDYTRLPVSKRKNRVNGIFVDYGGDFTRVGWQEHKAHWSYQVKKRLIPEPLQGKDLY